MTLALLLLRKREDDTKHWFGENFTTEGLIEDAVNVGDQFQIGSAKLVAKPPNYVYLYIEYKSSLLFY